MSRVHELENGKSATKSKALLPESAAQQQNTLVGFLNKKAKWEPGSKKAESVTYKLAKTIFLDLQPLSVVEDTGFRELLHEASEGKYIIASRKTIRYNILPSLYYKARRPCPSRVLSRSTRLCVGFFST